MSKTIHTEFGTRLSKNTCRDSQLFSSQFFRRCFFFDWQFEFMNMWKWPLKYWPAAAYCVWTFTRGLNRLAYPGLNGRAKMCDTEWLDSNRMLTKKDQSDISCLSVPWGDIVMCGSRQAAGRWHLPVTAGRIWFCFDRKRCEGEMSIN